MAHLQESMRIWRRFHAIGDWHKIERYTRPKSLPHCRYVFSTEKNVLPAKEMGG
jgi:hypothetical protein